MSEIEKTSDNKSNTAEALAPNYVAKKFLGSGATANVYLATEDMSAFACDSEIEIPSIDVAVKVIDREALAFAELTQDDVDNEVQVHRDLDGHPHILQLRDYIEEGATVQVSHEDGSEETISGNSIMVLEYCSNGDLFDFVGASGGSAPLKNEQVFNYVYL